MLKEHKNSFNEQEDKEYELTDQEKTEIYLSILKLNRDCAAHFFISATEQYKESDFVSVFNSRNIFYENLKSAVGVDKMKEILGKYSDEFCWFEECKQNNGTNFDRDTISTILGKIREYYEEKIDKDFKKLLSNKEAEKYVFNELLTQMDFNKKIVEKMFHYPEFRRQCLNRRLATLYYKGNIIFIQASKEQENNEAEIEKNKTRITDFLKKRLSFAYNEKRESPLEENKKNTDMFYRINVGGSDFVFNGLLSFRNKMFNDIDDHRLAKLTFLNCFKGPYLTKEQMNDNFLYQKNILKSFSAAISEFNEKRYILFEAASQGIPVASKMLDMITNDLNQDVDHVHFKLFQDWGSIFSNMPSLDEAINNLKNIKKDKIFLFHMGKEPTWYDPFHDKKSFEKFKNFLENKETVFFRLNGNKIKESDPEEQGKLVCIPEWRLLKGITVDNFFEKKDENKLLRNYSLSNVLKEDETIESFKKEPQIPHKEKNISSSQSTNSLDDFGDGTCCGFSSCGCFGGY